MHCTRLYLSEDQRIFQHGCHTSLNHLKKSLQMVGLNAFFQRVCSLVPRGGILALIQSLLWYPIRLSYYSRLRKTPTCNSKDPLAYVPYFTRLLVLKANHCSIYGRSFVLLHGIEKSERHTHVKPCSELVSKHERTCRLMLIGLPKEETRRLHLICKATFCKLFKPHRYFRILTVCIPVNEIFHKIDKLSLAELHFWQQQISDEFTGHK